MSVELVSFIHNVVSYYSQNMVYALEIKAILLYIELIIFVYLYLSCDRAAFFFLI